MVDEREYDDKPGNSLWTVSTGKEIDVHGIKKSGMVCAGHTMVTKTKLSTCTPLGRRALFIAIEHVQAVHCAILAAATQLLAHGTAILKDAIAMLFVHLVSTSRAKDMGTYGAPHVLLPQIATPMTRCSVVLQLLQAVPTSAV